MNQKEHYKPLVEQITSVSAHTFADLALDVFRYQASHNPLYRQYLQLIGIKQDAVCRWQDIPCLPIQLFKNHLIQTGYWEPETIFTSSGTTGSQTSRHALRDGQFYIQNARKGFEQFYGSLKDYCVLALLPSYLERQGSSLIYMAADFIKASDDMNSGFFLDDTTALMEKIEICRENKKKVLLLGVSFALLELAEELSPDLQDIIVMETGGMKGRRKEMTRPELHAILKKNLNVKTVHSEYGMTELLSQAYSLGEGIFHPSASMQISIREPLDPRAIQKNGKAGVINVIDLANIDTISFIATQDLGVKLSDTEFTVLGRMDDSDIRGCNLLVYG